jgi:hypothetical protein|tara:strand:+ start:60 stop:260 length:201 start_codon:yes stop_codon:yes gene_type:complete
MGLDLASFLLFGPHILVKALRSEKFLMASTFHHMARVENEDFVGIHHRGKPVGDDQGVSYEARYGE